MGRGFSWKFHASFYIDTNRREFGQNWDQIPWPWNVIYPGFICSPCWKMTWILDKGKSWHLLRKWRDFHRIWAHFWPNCRQKDLRKSVSHFLQGCYVLCMFIMQLWHTQKICTEVKPFKGIFQRQNNPLFTLIPDFGNTYFIMFD